MSLESLTVAVISTVSASILIEGGAPRLLAESRNHQMVMAGKIFIMPFRRIKLRL